MAQNFADIVREVTATLARIASVAAFEAIASQYHSYLLQEARRFDTPESELRGPRLAALADLSHKAWSEAQEQRWEEALGRVHALLSTLPGEPISLPPKPPRPPWSKH